MLPPAARPTHSETSRFARLMQLANCNILLAGEHPAEEVYVTGTFDNWGKTVKLDKKDTVFEKTVALKSDEKILYKV
jgi:hypothetical protein